MTAGAAVGGRAAAVAHGTSGREGGAAAYAGVKPRAARHLGPRGRGRRPGARGNRRRAKGLTRGSVVGRAAA